MKELEMKNRKAISPVIATVILVAVAITVAVAVSYWMSGITSSYTKFEKVEIQSAVCTKDIVNNQWKIVMTLKNSGTATATLSTIYVNDIPADVYGSAAGPAAAGQVATSLLAAGVPIDSGANQIVTIYISTSWQSVTSGTTVNLKIHSAGGMDYIKLVELV
jgi:flagellin-like protein